MQRTGIVGIIHVHGNGFYIPDNETTASYLDTSYQVHIHFPIHIVLIGYKGSEDKVYK